MSIYMYTGIVARVATLKEELNYLATAEPALASELDEASTALDELVRALAELDRQGELVGGAAVGGAVPALEEETT